MQSGLLIYLVFGFIAFTYGGSSEGTKNKNGPMLCAGKNFTYTEDMNKIMTDCWLKHNGMFENTKKTKEERRSDMLCFMVCDSQGNGLINTEGKLLKDKIPDFVKKVYPASVTADLTKAFIACIDEHGSTVSTKDKKCDSYDALFKCVNAAAAKACEIDES